MTVRELLRALPVFDRELPVFDVRAVPDEPVSLFLEWLDAAIDAGIREPHAMTMIRHAGVRLHAARLTWPDVTGRR